MAISILQSNQNRWKRAWAQVIPALLSIVIAVVIGGLLLLANGRDPLGAYASLWDGAFGSFGRFTETLVKTTPFLILAISVSVSFRCQVWNIGAEGQFMLGAILSAWVGLTFVGLPVYLLLPLTLVAGIFGGALWSGIAGVLKAYLNANEVITTSMLNYIAAYLTAYLVNGPMKDPQGFNFPQSPIIETPLQLPHLVANSRLNVEFLLALVLVGAAVIFWRSSLGFGTQIVGASRRVAKYAGLNVNRTIVFVSLLTGGLAGIAGWGEIFGIQYRLIQNISTGWGSLAIVIALLGELNPIGMLVAAFLFASMVVGGDAMQRNAGVPFALVDVIQGIVILLILSRSYFFKRSAS